VEAQRCMTYCHTDLLFVLSWRLNAAWRIVTQTYCSFCKIDLRLRFGVQQSISQLCKNITKIPGDDWCRACVIFHRLATKRWSKAQLFIENLAGVNVSWNTQPSDAYCLHGVKYTRRHSHTYNTVSSIDTLSFIHKNYTAKDRAPSYDASAAACV